MENSRPGDILLDRYFKDADDATRERAREAFREFGMALLRLSDRLDGDSDSRPPPGGCKIPPSNTPEA